MNKGNDFEVIKQLCREYSGQGDPGFNTVTAIDPLFNLDEVHSVFWVSVSPNCKMRVLDQMITILDSSDIQEVYYLNKNNNRYLHFIPILTFTHDVALSKFLPSLCLSFLACKIGDMRVGLNQQFSKLFHKPWGVLQSFFKGYHNAKAAQKGGKERSSRSSKCPVSSSGRLCLIVSVFYIWGLYVVFHLQKNKGPLQKKKKT